MPLANSFVSPESAEAEVAYPLAALRCAECGLVQLSIIVAPEIMFKSYLYASSASAPLLTHYEAYAEAVVARFALAGSVVVEFGSNDGVLLAPLAARGVRVTGIDPATNLAAVANARGLETWNEFFGEAVMRRFVAQKGPARVVIANNVLAHVADLGEILRGLDVALAPDGVFIGEVPYLGDLIEHVEYDTIYHEHLSYFTLAPLERLFASAGLRVFDVERQPIQGGSIRIFVGRGDVHAETTALASFRLAEFARGLGEESTYREFALRAAASRDALRAMLLALKADGKRVAGVGAAAKGNTMLNYCHIGPELVEFIADSTPLKHGLLTPGMRIPVRPESALMAERPDYTVIFAWNFAEAIARKFKEYERAGGCFIHPIPLAHLYSAP